ncbi:hypothetical protein MKW94_000558, partial [Papaver nudicaule]|nr:hypothetical protein [Papaver nudicaule]
MAFHVAVKFQCFVLLLCLQLVSAEVPVAAASRPIAKPGCPDKCGNVSIPYPFGIGDGCFLDEWFEIICNKSHLGYRKPTTVYGAYNVSDISIPGGYMTTDVYTFTNCSSNKIKNYDYWSPLLYKFTISTTRNKFIVIGCNTYAYLKQRSNVYTATKCVTTCDTSEDAIDGSCAGGIGCCQAPIPAGLTAYGVQVAADDDLPPIKTCNYGFLAEANSFNFSSPYMKEFKNSGTGMVPVVIDWSIGYETCEGVIYSKKSKLYACGPNTDCIQSSVSGYRCSCKNGYEGNPYFNDAKSGGCQGSYNCTCPTGTNPERRLDQKFVCTRTKRRLPVYVVVPL